MMIIDRGQTPSTYAAVVAVLWLGIGCGPTLRPSTQPEGLETAEEAAETAAETTRADSDDRPTLYITSETAGEGGPLSTPRPPAEGRPDEEPEPADEAEARPETDRDLRTIVVEREDGTITVLHDPRDDDRAIAAFHDAVATLHGPEEPPQRPDGAPEQPYPPEWDADWQPDRLELDELSLTDTDRVELRGTAASEADVTEFLTRLNSLETFSEMSVASTEPVEVGQGVAFQITGHYHGGD